MYQMDRGMTVSTVAFRWSGVFFSSNDGVVMLIGHVWRIVSGDDRGGVDMVVSSVLICSLSRVGVDDIGS